ncbi:hypothetical protein BC834DRAFT_967929 [Gloeopeniophorella convolvens]|nr:hypothetical protein BC834DRAFT_967929 [Gloeopeniophorella convolvens]
MPKPTLLQSILGKPSQSYAFPPDKHYYSARHDFVRAAVAAQADAAAVAASPGVAGPSLEAPGPARFVRRELAADGGWGDSDGPTSSGSLSGDEARSRRRSSSNGVISSEPSTFSRPQISSPSIRTTLSRVPTDNNGENDSGSAEDDSDTDVFYTPFSSPPISMLIESPLALLPRETSPSPSPFHDEKHSSSASSSASSSHSCSTPPTSDELHAAFAVFAKRPASPPRARRLSPPSKSYAYTDEDWAKEVRWLIQPSASQDAAQKRRASLHVVAQAALASLPDQPQPRPRSRTLVSRPTTRQRMTALLEEDEDATDEIRASSVSPPPARARTSSVPVSRSNSVTSNSHPRPGSRASHTRSISLSARTVELPQIPTTAAPGPAAGYTTLTLPRASYRAEDPWRTLGGGRVDLPRDGRAQASMVSIEVVRGVASASFLPAGLRRRSSVSRPGKKHDLAGALALTSHRPPPSFVPSSDVLVQVYAVGLEGLDRQIVSDKVGTGEGGGRGAAGFVPGRGVLGRVVECGWEVSNETLKKGEWVIGLLDARKCGGLSEFVLLNRHRVHRAPQPSVPTPTPFPTPLRSRSASAPSFSLESLALLPLLGVSAYRAVRTYPVSKSSLSSGGGSALVLRGQDGVGGLATLMLRSMGVNVIVQVEPAAVGLDPDSTASKPFMLFSQADERTLGSSPPRRLQEVCARLRGWGVEGICVGAPLGVLRAIDADIDFVLDTVGGRELWDAAHALLARAGHARGPAQFTTLVGDVGARRAVPSAQDHWRAGVRNLRRAMSSKRGTPTPSPDDSVPAPAHGPRKVGYAWVSCVADVDFEGGDVRDALAAVLGGPAGQPPPETLLGLGGEYGAGRVLPFERAPEAFGGGVLEGGGTAVVRVVV